MYVYAYIHTAACEFCLDTKQIEDQSPELGAVLRFLWRVIITANQRQQQQVRHT